MNGLAQLVLAYRHMVTQKWPPRKTQGQIHIDWRMELACLFLSY